jgi:pilus assembly protein TadC
MKHEDPTPEQFAESVKEQLSSYIELRLDLFKAQSTEKLSRIFGKLISGLIMMFVLFFAILFVSLVGGFYLGKVTDSLIAGFGIIALFYVVLFIVLALFRKKIIELPVINQIIEIAYESDEA